MDGSTAQIRPLISNKDIELITWGDIMMAQFKHSGELEVIERVAQALVHFVAPRPNGIALVTVIGHDALFLSQESRQVMLDTLSNVKVLASATVVAGKGLKGVALRSGMASLSMLFSKYFPNKVFGTVEEACAWLAITMSGSHFNWSVTPIQIENAVRAIVPRG